MHPNQFRILSSQQTNIVQIEIWNILIFLAFLYWYEICHLIQREEHWLPVFQNSPLRSIMPTPCQLLLGLSTQGWNEWGRTETCAHIWLEHTKILTEYRPFELNRINNCYVIKQYSTLWNLISNGVSFATVVATRLALGSTQPPIQWELEEGG